MLNDFLLSPGSIKERQDRLCSLQSRFILAIRGKPWTKLGRRNLIPRATSVKKLILIIKWPQYSDMVHLDASKLRIGV